MKVHQSRLLRASKCHVLQIYIHLECLTYIEDKDKYLYSIKYACYVLNCVYCEIRGLANLSNIGGDFVKNADSYEKFANYIILFSRGEAAKLARRLNWRTLFFRKW